MQRGGLTGEHREKGQAHNRAPPGGVPPGRAHAPAECQQHEHPGRGEAQRHEGERAHIREAELQEQQRRAPRYNDCGQQQLARPA